MILRHSLKLLEQLAEVEEKIQTIEKLMEELEIECDEENLLKSLLAKRMQTSSGQHH